MAAIGGLDKIVKSSDKVFIKPNHLGNHPIERGINTHPLVLGEMCKMLLDLGAKITVGDGLDKSGLKPFKKSGTFQVCDKLGISLVNLKGSDYELVKIPNTIVKTVHFSRIALESDLIITMPKLKTHVLTLYTGAVKNSYGFLPEGFRADLHRQFIEPKRFSEAVVDVFDIKRPALAIMDAVVALEGNGPSRSGHPREVGLLLASRDCVALDSVASALIGFEPDEIVTTKIAAERGYGTNDLDHIDISGEPLQELLISDFAHPKSIESIRTLLDAAPPVVTKALGQLAMIGKEFPLVKWDACIGCALCQRHCPSDAIKVTEGKAVVNYSLCISCFCCQEFCESDAIAVGRTRIGEAVFTLFHAFKRLKRIIRSKKKS
jgi:uncharacterized protein (DUF362 family)/Pyruvate/2-oxoacid:ferredoxin oxidoreductase delta subunit